MLDDRRTVGALAGEIAASLDGAAGVQGGLVLGGGEVHLGPGQVGQAAGVVGVEVGEDDVPDVPGVEAERRQLMDHGLSRVEDRPHEASRRTEPSGGVSRVGYP